MDHFVFSKHNKIFLSLKVWLCYLKPKVNVGLFNSFCYAVRHQEFFSLQINVIKISFCYQSSRFRTTIKYALGDRIYQEHLTCCLAHNVYQVCIVNFTVSILHEQKFLEASMEIEWYWQKSSQFAKWLLDLSVLKF